MAAPRILVIDDDETHLVCTKELLEEEGYDVQIHATAFGATEKVMSGRPDLVLVDVNMPALSGEGLVAVLRRREATRRIPILLHSSNDEDVLREAARRLGIEGYVCKGDPAQLVRAIAAALRVSAPTRPRCGGSPPGREP
jgi:CheY-like chemotaxis protein